MKLPFMGRLSFEVRKQLRTLLQNNYPQMKFTFVFNNSNTIANFLKQPTRCHSDLCSNVVYLFTCPDCQVRYVGSTSRWPRHRILEHKGRSPRTGPPCSNIRWRNHPSVKAPIISCQLLAPNPEGYMVSPKFTNQISL